MRIFFSLIFFLLFSPIFGEPLSLKSQFQAAKTGSWVVLSIDKVYTLFYLRHKTDKTAILEEVTIGKMHLPAKKYQGWRDWFEQGAEGHTHWAILKINLQSAEIEQCYSPSHRKWINPGNESCFFSTLLNLHFTLVPENQRKRIGRSSCKDRPIWEPKCVVEGSVKQVAFAAYQARWPADGSEIAKKIIEIYMPLEANLPSFFPYWLEVEGKIGAAKARVIDSGFDACSPQPPYFE